MDAKKIIDKRYVLLDTLGSGGFGTVYRVLDLSNGREYALKLMNNNYSVFINEVKINKKIKPFNNPFFIKYIDSNTYAYLPEKESRQYDSYIVFELASKGDAISYITHDNLGLNERLSKYFFSKILQIVISLHRIGICHRDLKLDNFLFDGDNFTLKLSDFGFSSLIIRNKLGKTKKQRGSFGTGCYKAPEVVLEKEEPKGYDGEKADIFSLGVILFSLRTCKIGFINAKSNDDLYKYIKEGKIAEYWSTLKKIGIDGLSEEFKNLYIKMVSPNPKNRPTLEQIYNDEWLKEIRDLSEEELVNYEKELIAELKRRE